MSAALESLMRLDEAQSTGRRRLKADGLPSFVVIGAGATAAYVALSSLAITLLAALPAWLVSIVCYGALIVPVYLLHRRFSFRSEAAHRQALPRYIMVQAVALLLTALFGYVLYGGLAVPTPFAAVLVAGLTAGMNFVVLKLWAFAAADRAAMAS